MNSKWTTACCFLLFSLTVILLVGQGKAPSEDIRSRKNPPALSKTNLNQASLEELQKLPGIGPALAQRIVEFRKKNSPFRRVEDLLIIRGISRQKLDRIRPLIGVK